MVTELFLFRPIFMFELLCAEGVFLLNLPRKNRFGWRFLAVTALCFLIAVFFPLATYNAWYCSFMFLCLFAVTVAGGKFLFQAPLRDVLFCAISGFTLQHFVHELVELVDVVFDLKRYVNFNFYGSGEVDTSLFVENISAWILYFIGYFLLFAIAYVAAYFLFSRQIKRYNLLRMKMGLMLPLVAFIIFVDVLFGAIVTYSQTAQYTERILLHIYNIACCVLALILLFELPRRKNLEIEMAANRRLFEKERRQYLMSKENIELINVRCHDLKYQIRQIGRENVLRKEVVEEIEDVIDIYDSAYKTQNEVLNVILTEKSLLCKKESIDFSCIADGSSLSFISDTDLYSLFGNLLDNAIEAVRSLESDRRVIGVSVKAIDGMLLVKVYNNYKGKIRFEEDLPVTSKEDKSSHGFGLRSVRRIVEKYNGEMAISTENGIFEVDIALPL